MARVHFIDPISSIFHCGQHLVQYYLRHSGGLLRFSTGIVFHHILSISSLLSGICDLFFKEKQGKCQCRQIHH
jgi:hypothetical protein